MIHHADEHQWVWCLWTRLVGSADHAALLFAHAQRIRKQIEELRVRQAYIEAKASYWQGVADGEAEAPNAQRSIQRARHLPISCVARAVTLMLEQRSGRWIAAARFALDG